MPKRPPTEYPFGVPYSEWRLLDWIIIAVPIAVMVAIGIALIASH